ncbi:ABC transporter substrate-binding protein [Alteribacillus sp. HJP-4]|uniref:ABC transporter substrate-binding protein n=1 Tax=Alteribacillus sp. HJP-4 TaxID=2775394 RepID=UPI0035CD3B7F
MSRVKNWGSFITFVLMMSLLTACGGEDNTESEAGSNADGTDENSGGETATLELWHYFVEGNERVLTEYVNKFNEENENVDIELTFVPYEELSNQLLVATSGGQSPDMVIGGINEVQYYGESGALIDMTSYTDEWEYLDSIPEGIQDIHQLDGSYYGLPIKTNAIAMFYNTDVVETPPETWDELRDAAAEATTDSMAGFAASAHNSQQGTASWYPFLLTTGETINSIDSAGGEKALQLWTDLIEDGSMSEEVINKSLQDVTMDFANERAAMSIGGPWDIPIIEEEAPDLNWALAEIPKDEESTSLVGGESISITDEANKDEAWEFIEWFLSPEVHKEYVIDDQQFPVMEDVFEDPYFQEDESRKVISNIIQTSKGYEWGQNHGDYNSIVYTTLQNVLTGSASIEDALQDAQRQADEIEDSE